MNGALVYEGAGETTLDISEFEAGIYQVNVLQNDLDFNTEIDCQLTVFQQKNPA
jgi:hypothetical protein